MSDEKANLYNRISSLFEENKIQFPDNIIMNPRYKRDIDTVFGVDYGAPEGDKTVLGMKVNYSSFVDEDTVYIVNNPRNFGYGKSPIIDAEIHLMIERHFQAFFNRAFLYGNTPEYKKEVSYNWYQFPDENILQWGDRLAERGLLDNPEIRWEYQKTVLGMPFKALKSVWLRIKA